MSRRFRWILVVTVAALVLAGPATHWRKGRVIAISSVSFPILLLMLRLMSMETF